MLTGLSVKGLVKNFGDFRALNHVSFDIQPGEFCYAAGCWAAAKRLCCSIAGFIEPDEGEIIFNGS